MVLWKAFSNFIVVFYLLSGFLQLISEISTHHATQILAPVLIVIAAIFVSEIVEEVGRWLSDKAVNDRAVKRVHASEQAPYMLSSMTTASQIKVGDIVLLDHDSVVPADCVMLQSGDFQGRCYLNTAIIDGERHFKAKLAPEITQERLGEITQNLNDRNIEICVE